MSFIYPRTVYFRDTDAAGVVYFANVLAMCHEAYEASLAESGIDLRTFFRAGDSIVPIVHAEVDFLRPMVCGDRLSIHLTPHALSTSEFEIHYTVFLAAAPEKPVSKASTRHVCIAVPQRTRQGLFPALAHWLQQWSETDG